MLWNALRWYHCCYRSQADTYEGYRVLICVCVQSPDCAGICNHAIVSSPQATFQAYRELHCDHILYAKKSAEFEILDCLEYHSPNRGMRLHLQAEQMSLSSKCWQFIGILLNEALSCQLAMDEHGMHKVNENILKHQNDEKTAASTQLCPKQAIGELMRMITLCDLPNSALQFLSTPFEPCDCELPRN